MTAPTSDSHSATHQWSPLPLGHWHVDPLCSHASFTAHVAGSSARGRLPLTGVVSVAPRHEDSVAHLTARASEVSTGNRMLDRVLGGPGFLDTETYPTISFRSHSLVRIPTGWRSAGRLQVKGIEHPMWCDLETDVRSTHERAAIGPITLTTRWLLESRWVTTKRLPTLGRRIAMTCLVVLDPATGPLASH